MKLIESIDNKTDVIIKLEINNMEFFSFNLSNATENKYIDAVNVLSSKVFDNNFYLIFSFEHMSNPGSIGLGNCGAGVEEYLGFLHINESFEVVDFNYYLTESCGHFIEQEYYYDKEFPENGIKEIE